jgi:CheY-like chemotaxis protein
MQRPTVLVIDDVVAIVEELLTLMQLHGVCAVGVADLQGAIEVLEREPAIRLISCDVRLDRESGLEIVERIKGHPTLRQRDFQYLFMTGDPMQLDRLGADPERAMLSKPVQPAVLIDTVQRMLAQVDA